MNWKSIDEKLIKRGELLLSLDFLKEYDNELRIMNNNNIGHPFKITNGYIKFLAIIRYLFSMPHRQIEGFTRALNKLIPKLPSIDYSWIRRRIIKLDLSPYKYLKKYNDPITIAIDSSSIKVHKSGEWIERIYKKKKHYIKIHFAIDVKTKEIVSMEVTTDEIHDSEVLKRLILKALNYKLIYKAYMDGSYDSSKTYDFLKRMKIIPIIKPRKNARIDRGPPERCNSIKIFKNLGEKEWSKMMNYGKRWAVETAFSTFKRLYGEYCGLILLIL